ncbi:DUF4259 domain-containing protein [Luedemannella helvata]|uniref:DUF4259 domain-containing protein n=1 Tax=Luedemannella helvata TaxID=349315 RepID=A0ABP4WVE4_9ACTN
MGTWGTGPFGSDGALDLLDELAELEEDERLAELGRILSATSENPELLMSEVYPDEVVAAAALVAISLPGGASIGGSQGEAVADELAAAALSVPAFELAGQALMALNSVAGQGGLWLSGWTDDEKLASATQTVTQLRVVLESVVGS